MPHPQDVVLGGVEYTVVPGTWKKRNAPATDLPKDVKRLTLGPFTRGQRQALDSPLSTVDSRLSTRGWDSPGVGPCFDGQIK